MFGGFGVGLMHGCRLDDLDPALGLLGGVVAGPEQIELPRRHQEFGLLLARCRRPLLQASLKKRTPVDGCITPAAA